MVVSDGVLEVERPREDDATIGGGEQRRKRRVELMTGLDSVPRKGMTGRAGPLSSRSRPALAWPLLALFCCDGDGGLR